MFETGGSETFVKTGQTGGSQNFKIRISDLLAGKDGANPQILSGDVVTVVEASPIYVVGGVNNPGRISSKSAVTLTRAIASVGGLSKDAVEDKITILRRDGRQSSAIEVNLRKIIDKQANDPELKAFDIVDVGQKGRGKRKFPSFAGLENASGRTANLPLRVID
jgi:protein involved in polysaccharide export with SLBB domain